jgi:hypothetical protein
MLRIDPGEVMAQRPAVGRSLYVRLIHQSALPPSMRLVLLVIAWSARADGTGCYLSLAAVSTRTGLTPRRCQQLIASARQDGWLVAVARPGRTNDWLLAAPAPVLQGCNPVQGGVKPTSGGGEAHFTRRKNLGSTQEVRARRARRAWCGVCAEETRLRQDPDGGTVRRCPECHPLAEPLRGPDKPHRSRRAQKP